MRLTKTFALSALFLLAFILPLNVLIAQKRVVLEGMFMINEKKDKFKLSGQNQHSLQRIPEWCARFFERNDDFMVTTAFERAGQSRTQPYQTGPDFIQAHMQEQAARLSGAYLVKPYYIYNQKRLVIALHMPGKGNPVYTRSAKVSLSKSGAVKMEKQINAMLHALCQDAFLTEYPVVRSLKKTKTSTSLVLVEMGATHKAIPGSKVVFHYYDNEIVKGKVKERRVQLAKGKISKVLDGRFSEIKISQGGKNLHQIMESAGRVYLYVESY
jgi:hypothetical protein